MIKRLHAKSLLEKKHAAQHLPKQTRMAFRTWKSGKKWLYGSTALVLLASSFSGVDTPFYQSNIAAYAAILPGVGVISPGTQWDTGNHAYQGSDLSNLGNYTVSGYTPSGTNLPYTIPGIGGSGWFQLVNNQSSSKGYAVFNGAISTQSSFQLNATIKAQGTALVGANWQNAGDALGFILTPQSSNSLTTGGTGEGLGIQNLPNTYFLGRDLYNNFGANGLPLIGYTSDNKDITTPSLLGPYNGGSNEIAIRSTDTDGNLITANYPTAAPNTTNGQAWTNMGDAGEAFSSVVQEQVQVSWAPDSTNTAPVGYSSGTLTLYVTPDGGGTPTVISTHTNLQNSMSLGFVAATGGNYGNLTVSLNGTSGFATRGTEPVQVNYINSVTNQPIAGWAPSTVNANVADKIAVAAPGTATSSPTVTIPSTTYTYAAPQPPVGYSYSTTQPQSSATVQNFAAGTANPNVINVYYTPNYQQANVWFSYASNTPENPVLATSKYSSPASAATGAGYTDATIYSSGAAWTSSAESLANSLSSVGYSISYVYNGTSYATLSAAYAADTGSAGSINTYTPYSNSGASYAASLAAGSLTNDVEAVITANTQSAVYTASFAANTPGSGTNPGSLQMSQPGSLTTTGSTGTSLGTSFSSLATAFPSFAGYGQSINAFKYNSAGSVTASSVYAFTTSGYASAVAFAGSYYTGTNPETNQQFVVQYVAKNQTAMWYYKPDDQFAQDPANGAYIAYQNQLTGSPTIDNTAIALNNSPLNSGEYTAGYEYFDGSGDNTYTTWAELIAAHPDVGNSTTNIYILIKQDQTSLASQPIDTQSVGQLSSAGGWSPSSDLTTMTNYDGSAGTASNVNSSPISIEIRNSSNTVIWTGNATNTVPANLLTEGNYTVTYTSAAGPGGVVGSTTTTLTITNFTLPFTGGPGSGSLVGLAAAATMAGLLLKKRRGYHAVHVHDGTASPPNTNRSKYRHRR